MNFASAHLVQNPNCFIRIAESAHPQTVRRSQRYLSTGTLPGCDKELFAGCSEPDRPETSGPKNGAELIECDLRTHNDLILYSNIRLAYESMKSGATGFS